MRMISGLPLSVFACLVLGVVSNGSAELVLHFDMETADSPLVDLVSGITAEAVDDGHVYGVPGPEGFGMAIELEDNGSWQLDVDESQLFREFANDFTVASWIYLDSETQDFKLDLAEPNAGLNRFFGDDIDWDADGWGMGIWNDGRVRFTKNGVIDLDTDDPWIDFDEWYHVAATVSSIDGVSIYVNGELAQAFTDSRDLNNGVGNNGEDDVYAVGRTYSFAQGQWVGGRIDDLRIYDNVLTEGEIANLLVPGGGGVTGDFDGDGQVTANDIDLLTTEVNAMTNNSTFDLTNDAAVTDEDRIFMVEQVLRTYLGDTNLDGEFSSSDFVTVFTAGEYEDGIAANSTWSTGDWNGDGEFDTSDFVAAFTAGGYEIGPRVATQAVPEPGTGWMIGCAILLIGKLRRRVAAVR
ncbi:MAG: LamG-like jellyroll fold domain-containing protein [Pirellulaceae bacterium]